MATKQVQTWREATPAEAREWMVKEVIRELRNGGLFTTGGTGTGAGQSYDDVIAQNHSAVLAKVAETKAVLEQIIDNERTARTAGDASLDARVDVLESDVRILKNAASNNTGGTGGTGTANEVLVQRVTTLEQGQSALATRARDAETAINGVSQTAQQANTAATNAAASAKTANDGLTALTSRVAALEAGNGGGGNTTPITPASPTNTGITLAQAESLLAQLNGAYPAVTPKLSSHGAIDMRNTAQPSAAMQKAFTDAVASARAAGGAATAIKLPDNALVDLLAGLNKKAAGRHNTAGGIATHCINDYLPLDMQVDVLLPKPKLVHSFAIFDALEAIGETNVNISAIGQFRMSKLHGKLPEIFGTEGNFAARKRPEVKRYGAQPTMILRPNNVNYDFKNAVFIVDKMFQVGFEVVGYLGDNTAHMGSWFTQRILDLDPNNAADEDWVGTLSPVDLSKHFIPPSDKMTGASVKGRNAVVSMADGSGTKWVYEGFNTTMNNGPGNPNDWSNHIELSNARSNMVDTSTFASGGYKPLDAYATWEEGEAIPSAFPQENGTTAPTWGTWGGGWIGNWGSGGMIYQYPRASQSKHDKARFTLLGGYFRGFRSYGIEVGILSDPAGNEMPRHAFNYVRMRYDPAVAARIAQYVPHNVWLKNITVEDCYEGGINANRFVNLTEEGSFVRRTGLPGWSLHHRRIEHVQPDGRPANAQVDPGYGSSSSRASPQRGRRVIDCTYVQCPRKGIDGHHGTETVLEDIIIDAGIWGVQWVFDEPQSDIRENSFLQNHLNTLVINRVFGRATNQGLSLHNGSFGALTHKSATVKRGNFEPNTKLWALRTDAKISNCVMAAEFPYFDNYARSATYTNCTAVRGNGFGGINPYSNKSVSCGYYLGSGNISRNGISPNLVIRDCKLYNSPQGNFGAIARIGAVAVCRIDGLFADITPYRKASAVKTGALTDEDALMIPYTGADPTLAGVSTTQFAYTVTASSVADTGKFAYDVTASYAYNALTGAITPLKLA